MNNSIPCQSDIAQREWDRMEDEAEAKEHHKADIVERCFKNEADWVEVRDMFVDQSRVDELLDLMRVVVDNPEKHERAFDKFVNLVVDTVDDNYDELDTVVSGSEDEW